MIILTTGQEAALLRMAAAAGTSVEVALSRAIDAAPETAPDTPTEVSSSATGALHRVRVVFDIPADDAEVGTKNRLAARSGAVLNILCGCGAGLTDLATNMLESPPLEVVTSASRPPRPSGPVLVPDWPAVAIRASIPRRAVIDGVITHNEGCPGR